MKVLFDNNIPRRLRKSLSHCMVKTAFEMGWERLANGRLIQAAEDAGFQVLITGDKSLTYQQNLTNRNICLIVLTENNWNYLQHSCKRVVEAVSRADRGSYELVPIPRIAPN